MTSVNPLSVDSLPADSPLGTEAFDGEPAAVVAVAAALSVTVLVFSVDPVSLAAVVGAVVVVVVVGVAVVVTSVVVTSVVVSVVVAVLVAVRVAVGVSVADRDGD